MSSRGWHRLPGGDIIGAYGKSGSTSLSQVPELTHLWQDELDLSSIIAADNPWVVIRDPAERFASGLYQSLYLFLCDVVPPVDVGQQNYLSWCTDINYWCELIDKFCDFMDLNSGKGFMYIREWDQYHMGNYLSKGIYQTTPVPLGIIPIKHLSHFLSNSGCTPVHTLKSSSRLPLINDVRPQILDISTDQQQQLGQQVYDVYCEALRMCHSWNKIDDYLYGEYAVYNQILHSDLDWVRTVYKT